jgi:hypothetical protein
MLLPQVEAVGGGHQTVAYASNVVRFELPSTSGAFSTTSVSTIDLAAVDADLRGFSDGVVHVITNHIRRLYLLTWTIEGFAVPVW